MTKATETKKTRMILGKGMTLPPQERRNVQCKWCGKEMFLAPGQIIRQNKCRHEKK